MNTDTPLQSTARWFSQGKLHLHQILHFYNQRDFVHSLYCLIAILLVKSKLWALLPSLLLGWNLVPGQVHYQKLWQQLNITTGIHANGNFFIWSATLELEFLHNSDVRLMHVGGCNFWIWVSYLFIWRAKGHKDPGLFYWWKKLLSEMTSSRKSRDVRSSNATRYLEHWRICIGIIHIFCLHSMYLRPELVLLSQAT
jgi:hypothetical protein